MSTSYAKVRDLDRAFVLHPVTDLVAHQSSGAIVIVRGKGIHVWDDQGKEYIEGMSGLWCTSLGFGDEELAEVAREAVRDLSYATLFSNRTHPTAAALSEKLISIAPFPASKVFLGCSGSDANDTQLRMMWYYNNARGRPKKKKIICRQKAYHGSTLAAASLTGLDSFHTGFDAPLSFALRTDCPYYYRFAEKGESEEEYSTRLAKNLEDLIVREDPETIAAFIAEPVIGAGGVILPPAGYFAKIQQVLRKYDIELIDDEVICGFGRTGNVFGAQSVGMAPSTMTVAKALSSGYAPISGVLVNQPIYEALVESSRQLQVFGHGFTYSGHPLATALALKTLEIYESRGIYDHVRRVSSRFVKRMTALKDHPLVGDARAIGLLGGLQIVKDKASRTTFNSADGVGVYCAKACIRNGLMTRSSDDNIAIAPPYIVTEADIDEIFDRLQRSLDETLAWASQEKLVA